MRGSSRRRAGAAGGSSSIRSCGGTWRTSGEQRAREVVRVERAQVLERLADADQLDRDAELGRDRHGDPALRGAVELGQHDAVDLDGLGEQLRLAQTVLAGG